MFVGQFKRYFRSFTTSIRFESYFYRHKSMIQIDDSAVQVELATFYLIKMLSHVVNQDPNGPLHFY